MSKLSKFMGEPKEYTIGGEKFVFKPLKVKDLDLIFMMQNESKQAEGMSKIIAKTLKEAVPDATDEEIEGIGIKYFQELTEAIMDVNGLNDVKSQGKNRQTLPQNFRQKAD